MQEATQARRVTPMATETMEMEVQEGSRAIAGRREQDGQILAIVLPSPCTCLTDLNT